MSDIHYATIPIIFILVPTMVSFLLSNTKKGDNKEKITIDKFASIVQIIFLPIMALTGYFGMNFKSMGIPSLDTGIYNVKHGQHFILYLSLVMIVIYLSIVVYL